jgi:hypothetical protein
MYLFGVVFMLAVTVTTSEKTLSELKIQQHYIKNSIGQTKLNDLATLDIEEKDVAKMDIKGITSDFFAKARNRTSEFFNYALTKGVLLKITHAQIFRKLSFCNRQ